MRMVEERRYIRIAVPNKGRLHQPSIEILARAGYEIEVPADRALFSPTSDEEVEIVFARAGDIPILVQDGVADLGITGYDLVLETEADVEILLDLGFGRARMVVATLETSPYESLDDLPDGCRIATEFPRIVERFLGKRFRIVEMRGATEIAPHIGVADVIVDLSSTGTTLRTNRLKVIGVLFETSARLIANRRSLDEKREKIEEVKRAVESVLIARGKKLVLANIPEEILPLVKEIMPGMAGPTVSRVEAEIPMLAVNAVVDEKDVRRVINELKKIGARDILVLPIERIVP